MGARYSIQATRSYQQGTQFQSTPPPSDRAFHPGRVVGHDPRPAARDDLAQPVVSRDGQTWPVEDLNWAITNREHAHQVSYERSPSTDWEAIMKITGTHPEAGPFEFQVGWRDRNRMRDWTSRRLPEVPVADRLRDGGY